MVAVRSYRGKSKRKSTLAIADYPTKYNVEVIPNSAFLALPEVSSERREYMPIGWMEPPVIPSNKLRLLPGATLTDFALLTSAMHMAWMRAVTGRLESRYMYSVGVVYNTFPTPPEGADLSILEPPAQAVLDARAAHPGRDTGRTLRSRPDAAGPAPRPPGPRPRRGPALPPQRLRHRARARRASVHALRKNARAAGSGDETEGETQAGAGISGPAFAVADGSLPAPSQKIPAPPCAPARRTFSLDTGTGTI